jgi:hypothetical protein
VPRIVPRTGSADAERIRGIREDLPAGEHVLWQGAPSWAALAIRVFHVRSVAIYFLLLSVGSLEMTSHAGEPATAALAVAALGAVACGLLATLAWLAARTTIYAITTRRVFMRIGIALPISVNLPLHRIESAGLGVHGDGTGDLPLQLGAEVHLAYLHLWPHVRPWRLRRTEPMVRAVSEPAQVARILGDALQRATRAEST